MYVQKFLHQQQYIDRGEKTSGNKGVNAFAPPGSDQVSDLVDRNVQVHLHEFPMGLRVCIDALKSHRFQSWRPSRFLDLDPQGSGAGLG